MSDKDDIFLGRARALNILMVLRAPVGGLFRHVLDLTEKLHERGHKVGIVYHGLKVPPSSADKLNDIAPFATLGLFGVNMPRTAGPGDWRTHSKISRLVKKLKIDVVHGHGAKGGLHARLAPKVKLLGGQKTARIYTPHGGVLHFDRAHLSGKIFLNVEESLIKRADAMIFESAYAKSAFETKIGTPHRLTKIIHNGLREPEFAPIQTVEDDNVFFEGVKGPTDFVFVGEMRKLKGVQILLHALYRIGRETGTPPSLILAGDGPDREEFEQLATQLGLDGFVRFVGQQPALNIFAAGKVLVVPSLNESLPYVIMEACGGQVPVIATDVGGINELFGPTKADLVKPNDIEGLSKALEEALRTPEKLDDAALTRFKHVKANFNVTQMTEQIEDIYYTALMGY